ncbi:MAG: hypothetical protein GC192_12575 [Bacteroidetes bacterium]|nr:hypothetical protein [Bacteroidota bacterium]
MTKKSKTSAKTRLQIADEYDIHYQTLWRMLKENNITLPNGRVLPKGQKVIYEKFGYPKGVERLDYEEI